MRIGKIIGRLTLGQQHPLLRGGTLKIVQPMSLPMLINHTSFSPGDLPKKIFRTKENNSLKSQSDNLSDNEKKENLCEKKSKNTEESSLKLTILEKEFWKTDLIESSLQPKPDELVIFDQIGAGEGEWIAFTEGAEAVSPFYPKAIPIDAYCSMILDTLELDQNAILCALGNKKPSSVE